MSEKVDNMDPNKKSDSNPENEETDKKLPPAEGSSTESKTNTTSWLPDTKWTSSWVNTAREKTKSTFETIRKDIHEFTDTLHSETNSLASAAAKKVQSIGQIIAPNPDGNEEKKEEKNTPATNPMDANTPKETVAAEKEDQKGDEEGGGGRFLGLNWVKQMANEVVETVQKFATEDTTKEEAECTEEIRLGPGGRRTMLDLCTLLQMQNDRRTFLQKPQRSMELYGDWLNDFKISEYNGEINLLLSNNPRLREIYAELVPSQVDNHTFWNRYFFKVHVKELEKQSQMQLNPEKADVATGEGHSPAPSNGRDDWSMCSDRTAEVEELDADVKMEEREDPATPRPSPTQKAEDEVEDWEECEGAETAAETAQQAK